MRTWLIVDALCKTGVSFCDQDCHIPNNESDVTDKIEKLKFLPP